jgi:hypothetical protein
MAKQKVKFITTDLVATEAPLVFQAFTAGALNGSFEACFVAPWAGELDDNPVILSVGVNTTHDTAVSITATLEKNGDGGTNMLATNPVLLDTAGVGQVDTAVAGTGVTVSAPSATVANKQFAKGDLLFVTVTEAGTGGADPSDVAVAVFAHRLQDADFSSQVARS